VPVKRGEGRLSGDAIAGQIEKDDLDTTNAFTFAEDALNRDETDKAYKLFSDFITRFAGSSLVDDAYFRMGDIALRKGDYDAATTNFQKIIVDHVDSNFLLDAKYKLALAYFKKREYKDSIQSLESLLAFSLDKGRQVAVMTTIADCYLNLARNKDGLHWYAKALGLDPEDGLRDKIEKRVVSVVEKRIKTAELLGLKSEFDDAFVGSYVRYALIIKKVDAGNYDEAKMEIQSFISETESESLKLKGKEALDLIVQRMDVKFDTIGCILPLSGRYAPYGEKLLKGVQLAAGIFSSEEGVPINLIIKDSKGDPEEAARLVDELVDEDKVIAIVGPLLSKVAEATASRSQERGVPLMALSQKNGIPDIGSYIFRNFVTSRLQTRTLAEYAINEMGMKRFAIMYPKDLYGEEMMSLFWNDALLLGAEVVGIEGYDKKQYDFGREIKRLVGMDKVNKKEEKEKEEYEKTVPIIDFDAVFIPDSYSKAAAIIPQFAYNDIVGIKFFGPSSWHSPKLVKMGEKYVRGTIFTEGFYADSSYENAKEFSLNYESVFGEKPGTMEAQSYDSTRMLVSLIKNGDARSRVEMKNALLMMNDFEGATGRTTVTDSGDVEKKLFVLTVNREGIVEADLPFWFKKEPEGEEELPVPLLQ
jgi:ABC-type branched-subunit amino acid transport system substrate-binding protein/predicted negative regulator of RcsB-dependent stress response